MVGIFSGQGSGRGTSGRCGSLSALERGVDLLGFLVGGKQTASIHRRAPSWSQTHRRPGQFTIQDPNAGASISATLRTVWHDIEARWILKHVPGSASNQTSGHGNRSSRFMSLSGPRVVFLWQVEPNPA